MTRTDALLQKTKILAWSPASVAAALCSLGLLIAITVATFLDLHQQAEREDQFQALTLRATDQLRIHMSGYSYGLRGIRSAILTIGSDTITRRQFHEYLASRKIETEFPGVLGYGYVRRVSAAAESAFLRQARTDGLPQFAIREFSPNPSDRWLVKYLEPDTNNAPILGLDLASEPARRRAIIKAIETGEATLTSPVTLVQAKSEPAKGFLILLPIYASSEMPSTVLSRHQTAIGLAFAPFLIDKVLSGFDYHNDAFSMVIRARSGDGQLSPVFSSRDANQPASKGLLLRQTLDLYGQQWQLEFKARPNFIRSMHHVSPQLIVIQIAFISSLLSALAYAYLISRRRSLENWLDKAKLGGIISNANDAIIGIDLAGDITSWNRAAHTIFGYAEADAIGRSLSNLTVPNALLNEHLELLQRVCRGESVAHFITRRCCQNQGQIDVGITAFPITDERDRVVGAAMIIRDVSQQVAAEERVRLLNANLEGQVSLRTAELTRVADLLSNVLDAASEMSIIATDRQGLITLFNAGAESLLGYQASELIGVRRVSELHSPEEINARAAALSEQYGEPVQGFRALVHHAELAGADVREWDYIRKLGTPVRVSLAVTVMRDRDGNITGYLAIAQDITERIERDHALQEAKQFAEQANEAKSRFLANMSHEIRTPMNGILGLCYMLEQQAMPETSHQLVQKIQSASQGLLGIINDVLDFSKIEANRLDIERIPFRLSTLIDDLASIARGTLRDKDVQLLIAPVPPIVDYVLGDQLHVGQVLSNLLSNAVKFTQHGRIELAVSVLEAPDADGNIRVQFLIRDSGIGIAEDKLQLIFEAFSQADTSTSRSYGGTGLGLTICRTLTHLMGGKIDVSSVVGEGSSFRVELPLKLVPDALSSIGNHGAVTAEAHPDKGKRLLGLRILLADDSELNREVAEFILSGEGASVEVVADGQAAVNLILGSANAYDVVLMDIQMPILDGYDATRAIRAIPEQQDLPVIALTAGAMASQRMAALEAGMNGFVTKPFNVDQLLATVLAHARKSEAAPVPTPAIMDAELNEVMMAFRQRFLSNRLPDHLQKLQAYLASEPGTTQAGLRAALHSMAGEAGMVDLSEIGDMSRHLETLIDGQEISDASLRDQVRALAAIIEKALAHSS